MPSEPLSDEVEAKLREIASVLPCFCRQVTEEEWEQNAECPHDGQFPTIDLLRAAYRLGLAHRSDPADYTLWRAERVESFAAQRRHDEGMKFADDSGRKLAAIHAAKGE